jgi:hypothetical protein
MGADCSLPLGLATIVKGLATFPEKRHFGAESAAVPDWG